MKKRLWGIIAVAITGVFFLAACGKQTSSDTSTKPRIVTSVDFYGEVAKAVVGKYGSVTSVINNPAIDPHDYEPTTDVGKTVAKANLVLENGAGYDSWMDKVVKANGKGIKLVSAAKVVGVKDGENEHIWYKPTAMPKIATALAQQLGKVDPQHKKAYVANAKAYVKTLQPLMTLIDQLKANSNDAKVAVSEPVFNNALSYMGYRVANEHFANAIEEGTDPSPADIREMKALFKDKKIAFFVLNTQVDSKTVTNMADDAKKAGIPILRVTETLPKGKTYTSWMTSQYNALAKIQAKLK